MAEAIDRLLDLLLEQQRDNHAENQRDIRELSALVRQSISVSDRHEFRIGVLEHWREKHADPLLKQFTDWIQQAKGALWLGRAFWLACGGAILAAAYALLPKLALLLRAFL